MCDSVREGCGLSFLSCSQNSLHFEHMFSINATSGGRGCSPVCFKPGFVSHVFFSSKSCACKWLRRESAFAMRAKSDKMRRGFVTCRKRKCREIASGLAMEYDTMGQLCAKNMGPPWSDKIAARISPRKIRQFGNVDHCANVAWVWHQPPPRACPKLHEFAIARQTGYDEFVTFQARNSWRRIYEHRFWATRLSVCHRRD